MGQVALALRSHVSQFEQSITAGELAAAFKHANEINRLISSLRRRLGLTVTETHGMAVSVGGTVSAQISPDQVGEYSPG